MTQQIESPDHTAAPRRPSLWPKFGVRTLLTIVSLVCVFFAGRASMKQERFTLETGRWAVACPNARSYELRFVHVGGDRYRLEGVPNCNFVGEYVLVDDKLVMDQPEDDRYTTLTWQWTGHEFVLAYEPLDYPSGGRYAGTRLWKVTSNP